MELSLSSQRIDETRQELISAALSMCRSDLVIGTWGNISCRCGAGIAITPSGMEYASLHVSDIPIVSMEGLPLLGTRKPSSELLLHLEIYKRFSSIQAIVHTHSTFASALAVARVALPPLLEEHAQVIGGEVPVIDYAETGTLQLAQSVARGLDGNSGVLLANHGALGVSSSLAGALLICQLIEKGAQIYCFSRLLGKPHILSTDQVASIQFNFNHTYGQDPKKGNDQ